MIRNWFSRKNIQRLNKSNGNRYPNFPQENKQGHEQKIVPFKRPLRVDLATRGVLCRMIAECSELGASEIFIGYPDSASYQCFANGEHYSGILPGEAFEVLREQTLYKSPVDLNWDECDAEELRLGITKGGQAPVFCISWRNSQKNSIANQTVEAKKTPPQVKSPSGELILIVDDDKRFCKILSRILEEQGFQTLCAGDGKEGLEILTEFHPALIITDIHMPHLAGPEFLLEAKRRKYKGPCLILTNDEESLTEAELILLGVTAYIKKSEDPRILLAWCRRIINIQQVA